MKILAKAKIFDPRKKNDLFKRFWLSSKITDWIIRRFKYFQWVITAINHLFR